jgi:hypothetical protein
MKKWVVVLFICCLTSNFSQTNISPQFSELKGIEDQLGNTHLFYRIYTNDENPPVYDWSNHIFHLDLSAGIDTLYISSSGHEDPVYNFSNWVSDVDYWNNNPAEFIYCGGATTGQFFEGSAFVERFDGYYNTIDYFWGSADYLDISPTNDSLLYLGVNAYGGFQTLSSSNGGRSWDTLNLDYQFLSLCTSSENIFFVENEDRELFRTTDSGNTFNLVDPEFIVDSRFFYDSDGQHIYRKTNNKLVTSDNLGEQFSWTTKYTSDSKIYISVDESISGTIYLADKKNILVSTDFGNNFIIYKTLDRKIVGIYKKSNSNKLYAATKYKIYEITPDTVQVVKNLPIPVEVLNYYPLAIGNKWVYNEYQWGQLANRLIKEIATDTMLPNGKRYYALSEYFYGGGGPVLSYERIDSINGKVYRYDEWPGIPDSEYVIDDLLAEVGDTAYSYRLSLPYDGFTIVIGETTFEKWGINKSKKVLKEYIWNEPVYSLVKDIGLDSLYFHDAFGDYYTTLKGCIIDGVVYGDTTVVSVEDKEIPIATSFKLEQNYPNPFNPSTVISYRLPVISNVTLIVYDVLGNEITTLVNEEKSVGVYEVEFNATGLPSGIYFYKLTAGEYNQTQKMIYLK